MLKKTLREVQKHLSPSSYMTAYWPKKKRKFVLGFRFIKRYLEGNLERSIYLEDLEQFKPQLISENVILPFEFELLKILISIKEYERVRNSFDGESKKRANDLMSPDSAYRVWAVEYFTEKEISQASPLIRQRLFDSDMHVVRATITALGRLEQQNSNPILRLMSHHSDYGVHTECATWLGINGNQQQDVAGIIRSLRRDISVSTLEALSELYRRGVPGTEQAIPILEAYLKMPQFYKQYSGRFMSHIVPLARNTLYLISGRAEHHPLYSQYSTDTNFTDPQREVVARRDFTKEGVKTILLGGKLIGKVVIKIVPEESYLAWRKAFTSKEFWQDKGFKYVPVEPILIKNGRLRVKQYKARKVVEGEKKRWYQTERGGETIYAVATQVLGPTLVGLRFGYSIEKSQWDKLRNDKNKIINGLKELGVEYDPQDRQHAHDHNFCVQFYKNMPRLYIIDFDHARLVE